MKIVYLTLFLTLYQSNFWYGLLVWGGIRDNILIALVVNQNNIVIIFLNKFTLHKFKNVNYKEHLLPIRFLYKKLILCTWLGNLI